MKRIWSLFFWLLPSVIYAEVAPCTLASAQDVLSCVLKQHPDILRAEAELRSATVLAQAAGQRPNPEVDSEFTTFSKSDQPITKVEAAYLHTVEFGQKRSRRIDQAVSKRLIAEARLQRTRETVVLDSVLKLYRLRQMDLEMTIHNEAVETFENIMKSYKSRARRSPEQQVSLGVFTMAHADAQLRRSALQQERISLETFFETALGTPLPNETTIGSLNESQWPSISQTINLQATARKEAQAELALSESGAAVAQSATWPDMRFGPRVEIESGHGQNNQGFGAALSLGMPLYHRNQGERRVAQEEMEQARVHLHQRERELSHERSKWFKIYEKTVTVLKTTPALVDLEGKHRVVENQFQRGLVSASLVIEAHRQMAEYAEHRHEEELRARQALWSIYILEGHALEVKL